jgi:hypothetical protein
MIAIPPRSGHATTLLACFCTALVTVGCRQPAATVDAAEPPAAPETADAEVAEAADAAGSTPPIASLPPFPSSRVPFEGVVTMSLTGAGSPSVYVLRIKGSKTRLEVPGHREYTIQDRAGRSGVTVSPAARTASHGLFDEVPFETLLVTGERPVAAGRVDTVAGFACDVYFFPAIEGSSAECCLVGTPFTSMEPTWFPLRIVMRDSTNEEKARIEVVKIEPKTLDPSLFVVPAGYRTVPGEGLQR